MFRHFRSQKFISQFVQNIQKNNYTKLGKNTIEIEENIYETKAYLLKLNGNELKDIIIKCLENSKSDNTVLDILERNGISDYTAVSYTHLTLPTT